MILHLLSICVQNQSHKKQFSHFGVEDLDQFPPSPDLIPVQLLWINQFAYCELGLITQHRCWISLQPELVGFLKRDEFRFLQQHINVPGLSFFFLNPHTIEYVSRPTYRVGDHRLSALCWLYWQQAKRRRRAMETKKRRGDWREKSERKRAAETWRQKKEDERKRVRKR